jgi:acyl-ACP thioesterase
VDASVSSRRRRGTRRAARLGDKLEILAHTHPAGSTDRFGAELADRAVRTLTYVAGDQTNAIALVFAL